MEVFAVCHLNLHYRNLSYLILSSPILLYLQ
jgi:hypothetical protein